MTNINTIFDQDSIISLLQENDAKRSDDYVIWGICASLVTQLLKSPRTSEEFRKRGNTSKDVWSNFLSKHSHLSVNEARNYILSCADQYVSIVGDNMDKFDAIYITA